MTFTLDNQVAAVLAAAIERNGPPPAPNAPQPSLENRGQWLITRREGR